MSLSVIDAHCHLADPKLDSIRSSWLKECQALGFEGFIQGGVDPNDWLQQIELQKQFPKLIHTSFGIHPWWIASQVDLHAISNAFDSLESLLEQSHDKAHFPVFLGETGLDFLSRFPKETHPIQKNSFLRHLELSQKFHLPLVLHVVRAHSETLDLLRLSPHQHKGLVHSFTGDYSTAKKYLDLGFIPAIGTALVNPRNIALCEAVKKLGIHHIVLESDAPDQPPYHQKGQLNSPLCILEVGRMVAHLTGVNELEVFSEVYKTTFSFLR